MRFINGILCLIMILFIAVQYNDPDGPMWMAIYSIPALWAALGVFRPSTLKSRGALLLLLLLCIAAALAGVYYYWPSTPQWWTKDVWWEVESAREGMGMMIVCIVLLAALLTGWRSPDPNADPNAKLDTGDSRNNKRLHSG